MAKTASIIVNHLGEEIELGGGTVTSVDGVLPDTNKNVPLTVTQTKQELQDSITNGTAVPGQFIVTSDENAFQGAYTMYSGSNWTKQTSFSGNSTLRSINWVAPSDCYIQVRAFNGNVGESYRMLISAPEVIFAQSYSGGSRVMISPPLFIAKGITVSVSINDATNFDNASSGLWIASIETKASIINVLHEPSINYSTEEQDTGRKWVDGRTIYSKSYVDLPWNVTAAVGTNTFKIDDLSRFGRVITVFPSVYVPTDNRSYVLPNIGASGNIIFYYRDFVNDSINVDYRKVVATVAQTFLVSCYLEYCKEN